MERKLKTEVLDSQFTENIKCGSRLGNISNSDMVLGSTDVLSPFWAKKRYSLVK